MIRLTQGKTFIFVVFVTVILLVGGCVAEGSNTNVSDEVGTDVEARSPRKEIREDVSYTCQYDIK